MHRIAFLAYIHLPLTCFRVNERQQTFTLHVDFASPSHTRNHFDQQEQYLTHQTFTTTLQDDTHRKPHIMSEATPRITAPYLEQFSHQTVRILGKVRQLRGEQATIDAGGQISVFLNRVCCYPAT